MTDVSFNWPVLLADHGDRKTNARRFVRFMQGARGKAPTVIGYGSSLQQAVEPLMRGLLMGQGPKMDTLVQLLREEADKVAAGEDAAMQARPDNSLGVLACAAFSEMLGHDGWDGLVRQAHDRLWAREPQQGRVGLRTAAASLARGHFTPVRKHLELPREKNYDVAPNGPFENPRDAMRQIARVLRDDSASDQAANAWTAYLRGFPDNMDPRNRYAVDWNELFWLARCIHVVLGGHPPAAVPELVLAEIKAL